MSHARAAEPGAAEPETSEPSGPVDPPRADSGDADGHDAELERRVEALERELAALREAEAKRATKPIEPAPRSTDTKSAALPASPKDDHGASAGDSKDNRTPDYAEGFHFGSYGRVIAGGDHRGRAGRDGDIVAFGSRLDESNYAELELRREDYWEQTDSYTRIVATAAVANPMFHYNGVFAAKLAMRNLYIEESGLGLKHLKVWAGSRMYRGDDIYVLNFWPLDNLNTLGGGLSYEFIPNLVLKLHTGVNQPDNAFFGQDVSRPRPLGQVGAQNVRIADRQKSISSIKLSHIFGVGTHGGGIKPVVYGEVHYTPKAQRERETQQYESLPDDIGYLVGAQLGLFTGQRSTHLNLVFRYAGGLAAYGELNAPSRLSPARTSKGAREMVIALSGNYEVGPFGVLLGSYFRSFRNASPGLDVDDVDEGIVLARPTVWFGKIAGLSLEGSYQAQRRGVLVPKPGGGLAPQLGQMGRIGLVPFLTPAGRGNYARPHIRVIYLLTLRDAGARRLYPADDIYAIRKVDHFIGLGAEWWFGSTSYFRD
ncbi:MAG: carbohydrate porin [Deltaproteobacteria bacterium]|nr:carbohydrate porin [Deltaproteobacteria bacterium]MBK8239770.1 carbohydrate porin [Deltaproteobacteria bacterium]MBP7288260.1 carbohydrate porin [Nannocystaceae bacterium]